MRTPMLKIALLGYGKMGKAIEEIALQKGYSIILKIGIDNLDDLTSENIQKADVAIEFSNPESAVKNVLFCLENNVPVLSGTTGWLQNLSMIEDKCREHSGTFLYASNYSIGVNIFFELNKKMVELMKKHTDYNVVMEEVHHTQKMDAPSGTAITLAEQIIEGSDAKSKWVNHAQNAPSELSIFSKRIDAVPGTHTVTYTSEIDDIEIKHTAHNRVGFAAGAIAAAEFLKGKKGIYSMKDVLGL